MPDDGAQKRQAADPCVERVTLVFVEGPLAGQIVELPRTRTTIGRREQSGIVLPSQSVSKQHCALGHDGTAFIVEDLGSTNGVIVNGTKLDGTAPRRLFHGDSIRIAESLALFQQTGCFQDSAGANRIVIDRARVAREADELIEDFAAWYRDS